MNLSLPRITFSILLLAVSANYAAAQKLDLDKLKNFSPRSIGPGAMSGRITSIDVVTNNPNIIYVGAASGGVWKSTNRGTDWKPIFDKENTLAIGSIAIQQSNPSVIWVGTGEGNPRNSVNSGGGIYRSLDGGETWKLMGLEKTKNIHRVIIDPQNPDVVYAAAIGFPWGEHPERGVYKTLDGGTTWQQVLFIDNKTGCADLVMDPTNPNKLIASMWEHRRKPWTFNSGGSNSGMHITWDGGKTWKKLSDKEGLPSGNLGRIGLAIAKSKPEIIYALIESSKNALYRSEDGGQKWQLVNDKRQTVSRPFYYCELYVDPSNENRVFTIATTVGVSEDGGKSFKTLLGFSQVHVDHHAFYIHPTDPDFMIDGNDGGLNISFDRGKAWRFVENLPVGQFYHINVDNDLPYNIYGGLQDNGSWAGPSYNWRADGLRNSYWQEVSFGDGFDVIPDPSDSRYGYSMSQGGALQYYDRITGNQAFIQPTHPNADMKLRFNWNSGFAQDPFDKSTVYYGSQFLHKSTNKGHTWEIISSDLTTNDPEKQKQYETGGLTLDDTGAEMHCSILAIAPSPLEKGVIWVGTDDGNVQLTRDGGKTWANVSPKIVGMPKGSWVPQIKASSFKGGEAWVVVNNYRQSDFKPYLFRTKDYGQTWENVAPEAKVGSWVLSVLQDEKEPKLVFLGSENGLYISIDEGKNWTRYTNGLPAGVPVMDMALQSRESDLVLGTFGRGVYVFDDINVLRELAKSSGALNETFNLVSATVGTIANIQQPPGERFDGHASYVGLNKPFGVSFTYVLNKPEKKEEAKTEGKEAKIKSDKGKEEAIPVAKTEKAESKVSYDSLTLQIYSTKGELLRMVKQTTPKENGVHQLVWNMRERGANFPSRQKSDPKGAEPSGFFVLPGQYKARMTCGDKKDSLMVNVSIDSRLKYENGALDAQYVMAKRAQSNVALAQKATDQLADALQSISNVDNLTKDKNEDAFKSIKEKGKAMKDSINTYFDWMLGKEYEQGFSGGKEPSIAAFLIYPSYFIGSSMLKPGLTEERLLSQSDEKLDQFLKKLNHFFEAEWRPYREMVEKQNLSPFKNYDTLQNQEKN